MLGSALLAHIRKALTALRVLASRPIAFFVVIACGGAWALFSPQTLDWQGIVALAVWMMTVLLQRAEHRDTQAIHAKLDHLLQAVEKADPHLSVVEKMQPEEIEKLRADIHHPAWRRVLGAPASRNPIRIAPLAGDASRKSTAHPAARRSAGLPRRSGAPADQRPAGSDPGAAPGRAAAPNRGAGAAGVERRAAMRPRLSTKTAEYR